MRDFDVIIIGGGHAGVEAALAVSRMECRAGLITMDATRLALMSCNPAIGGIGKSQIVKEIDVLGGIMGVATDATGIQFRRLNLSRGPAVWSTRVQCDRREYNRYVSDFVALQQRVSVIEGLAGDLVVESGTVVAVRLENGKTFGCHAVVIATGTFLGGLIHVGERQTPAGRIGEKAAYKLSDSFRALGFELGRLKTGTPPRLDGQSIDWSKCEIQPGENPIPYVSYRSEPRSLEQSPCFLTSTTQRTKEIILQNVHRSPMFSGQIKSGGPRYCPSIEDKFYRFADKPSHQIFLEPEGNGTSEVYPNGFSTSLPQDVQEAAIKTVIGLEKAVITRPGYAVEYDYCPTYQIKPSLETKRISGLFFAGQINGTSGYEEAAGQGLIAGINATMFVRKAPSFVLDRSESYIGVMIDDLVTRSTTEPYRMFTSRAEYRLSLREDNARDRLSHYAFGLGLITEEDYLATRSVIESTNTLVHSFERSTLRQTATEGQTVTIADFIRQTKQLLPQVVATICEQAGCREHDKQIVERACIQIKYHGYVQKQQREIYRFKKLERESIPPTMIFDTLVGLKGEAREKFQRFRPTSLGQASRIEGITASDVSVLAVHVKKHKAMSI